MVVGKYTPRVDAVDLGRRGDCNFPEVRGMPQRSCLNVIIVIALTVAVGVVLKRSCLVSDDRPTSVSFGRDDHDPGPS